MRAGARRRPRNRGGLNALRPDDQQRNERPAPPHGEGDLDGIPEADSRLGAADIGVDPALVGAGAEMLELTRLYAPVFAGNCEIIEGDTVEAAAEKLALRLREDKII